MKISVILALLLLQERQILGETDLSTEIEILQQDDAGDDLPEAKHYTVKNSRTTVKGTMCVFPFMFRGVKYVDCAPGIHQPNTWCATILQDNEYNNMKDWEVCAPDKRKDDDTCDALNPSTCVRSGIPVLCPLMCSRGIGAIEPTIDKMTVKGNKCIFPFINRGVHYNNCAPGINVGSPWCATRIKGNREYSEWEVCAPTASELASMNRFGMNDEAMEEFVESLQEAADYSESCLDQIKEIAQKIGNIEEDLGHLNSSKTVDKNERRSRSCADYHRGRDRKIEKIKIYPNRYHDDEGKEVLCDNEFDGGRWTIIQMRRDVRPREDFTRRWDDYVEGFGDLDKEFWIGLQTIHDLSYQHSQELHITMEDWDGGRRIARYSNFKVGSSSEKYKLTVSGYSGDAKDSLTRSNNKYFSTYDRDNDAYGSANCADKHKGGWWYYNCGYSNLNGLPNRGSDSSQTGIFWQHWRGTSYSLRTVTMKIRPRY